MKKKMKHDPLIIFVLFYVIFTSTIGCLCWLFTESGVLLFRIWYLMTTFIWISLAITVLVLFGRLSCLNKLNIKLQKLEKEMKDGKV